MVPQSVFYKHDGVTVAAGVSQTVQTVFVLRSVLQSI